MAISNDEALALVRELRTQCSGLEENAKNYDSRSDRGSLENIINTAERGLQICRDLQEVHA